MARTALRRPPPRRSQDLMPAAPTHQLAPRRNPWLRDATVCAATGVGGFGAAPLLAEPQWAIPALATGAVGALLRSVTGRRTTLRNELADKLVEALAPALGLRTVDRRTVRLRSWTRGWPGHPRRIDLRYAPGVDDTDPMWLPELVSATNRRLLANYTAVRHDHRRCRIRLALTPPEAETAAKPLVQARAERTVIELLGSTTSITKVAFDDDQLIQLTASHEAGTKLAAPQYRHRIERVISTMLPGRWRAHWDLENDTVRFEVRPAMPTKVDHPAPVITEDTLYRLPMAVTEDGKVLCWHMRGTAPHLIICGKTGTGKTVAITGVVMEAAARGWRVWICDPKTVEFLGLRAWPNVQIVATSIEHMVAVILRAQEEMERRYAMVEAEQADEDDFEPLVLVLDEYRDFVGMVTAWWQRNKVRTMPAKCPVFEAVASLARKGRTAKIHLIMGTQRPDAEFLGGEMRDNFASRMSLGRLSPQGALMMFEVAYVGVSVPRGIRGRGTAVDDDDIPVEVQGYWTPDPRRALKKSDAEDLAILDRLRPAEVTHPRLQVQLAEELLHPLDDDGSSPVGVWEAVLEADLVPALSFESAGASPEQGPSLVKSAQRHGTPAAAVDDSAAATDTDEMAEDAEQLDDEYGPEQEVRASRVQPGDRILADPSLYLWAVVEFAERDIDDEEQVVIDWRGDGDEAGSVSFPDAAYVTIRRPLDPSEEETS